MSYMLRADATDDCLDLEHELSVSGGIDYDCYLDCTCGRVWHFTDPIHLSYLDRLRDYHLRHRGL